MNFQPSPKEFRVWDGAALLDLGHLEYDSCPTAITLQWTGLKDKNGTKIFEGDITKALGRLWLVAWENCGFRLKMIDGSLSSELSLNDIEVLGNCFQNPDLMEGR